MANAFPESKAGIESSIIDGAIRTQRATGINPWDITEDPKQLEENNLDFELLTARGPEHLDLVEYAPLDRYGGRYENLPERRSVGEIADGIWSVIDKKASHYGPQHQVSHLLIYVTDFRMNINDAVFALVQTYCRRRRHGFKTVSYYAPIDMQSGVFLLFYTAPPGTPRLNDRQVRQLRQGTLINFDVRKFVVTPDGRGFSPQLSDSPDGKPTTK